MLTNQNNKKGWRLLGLWILANAVGWALGTLTGVILTWAFSLIPEIEGERVLPYAVLLSLGLSIGAVESVIMRWFDIKNSHWVFWNNCWFRALHSLCYFYWSDWWLDFRGMGWFCCCSLFWICGWDFPMVDFKKSFPEFWIVGSGKPWWVSFTDLVNF